MERKHANKAKGTMDDANRKQKKPNFDKPLGSSHKDEADLREVAKDARKKSK
jgi:hypothetical protein